MLWLLVEESIEKDLCELDFVTRLARLLEFLYNVLDYVLRCLVLRSIETLEECLGPNDAMDEFLWLLSDGAYRKALLLDPISALVALRHSLFDRHA